MGRHSLRNVLPLHLMGSSAHQLSVRPHLISSFPITGLSHIKTSSFSYPTLVPRASSTTVPNSQKQVSNSIATRSHHGGASGSSQISEEGQGMRVHSNPPLHQL